MKLRVNGEEREVRAADLASLIVELDYGDQLIATARNQSFVRKKEWQDGAQTRLADGDEIEILVRPARRLT